MKGAEKKDFKISDMDEWEGSDDGLDTDEEKVTSQCTLKKHTRHVTRVRKKPFKVKTDREKQRLR